jgi:hypothetical protein
MKSKILFGLLTIIIILFSGCVTTEFTPALTPPAKTPSLNVYGKIIDYSQDNLTIFKIQPEFINYELNNTYLEIETKPEILYNFTDDYLRCIKQNWYPTEGECKNHFYQQYNLSQTCRNIIELPEKGLVYLKCDVKFDLIKDNNYVFYFYKIEEKGPWTHVTVSENLTEYKERGSFSHNNDLIIDQKLTIEEESEGELQPGQMRVGRIFPTFIIPGGMTELKIGLINKQNNDISYVIKDAKIVDENILQPFKSRWEEPTYEDRLKDSIIKSCKVIYNSQENTISVNSTKELTFEVNCEDSIECRNWYISEDIRGNAVENVTTDCRLILWGQIEFIDELGNNHIIPELGMLKQMLTTGKRTNLTVEYSKEISSKEEFFIYTDYRDNEGNTISNAQIELKISGVSGIFSMRYDGSLGKYKFLWSDFYEHAPPFSKGTYQFTVLASKSGYEMKKEGPYIFVIK